MAQSDDSAAWYGILVIAVVGFAFSGTGWSNSLWYSFQYDVGFSDVQTDTKPSDCDFLQAPLGLKGCTYKAHVKVYNADGWLVAGDGAPMYGSDAGKNTVSYDSGKTWYWYSAAVPNQRPKSVKVSWVKE